MTTTCPNCEAAIQLEAPEDGAIVPCLNCGINCEVHLDAHMNMTTGEVAAIAVLEPLAKEPTPDA